MSVPWWQDAVIYQIYPRSFADQNGDGIGDLAGIESKLDHLLWLGVDALWISPFFPSPMRDFGYDVSNYCDVDPIFGTLADFDSLLAAAHSRDLRVLIDWVPAHTSSDHPWFQEAKGSRSSARRDWYVWRDPNPDGSPPNNWRSTFTDGAPAWTLDEASGQLYLHSFLPEQPDLNWENPEVVRAMHDVLRFWLDRGVDGFRADVIHNIGKDPALPDVIGKHEPLPHSVLNDDRRTHEHLRAIRQLLDSYPGDRVIVGEVFLLSTEQVTSYYGRGDEMHLCFNFPPLFARWQADRWRACIEKSRAAFDSVDAWPTWVLSNHDQKRHRTRYGSEARARAAAVLLLALRGTPFLYQGEELGLEDATIPPAEVVDPGGRDGCRAPIPWTAESGHSWSTQPWLPFPPEAALRNAASERDDPDSILHLYRRVLAARRASPALRRGSFELLPMPDGLLAFERVQDGDRRVVVINFEEEPQRFEAGNGLAIEVASDSVPADTRFAGSIAPLQALILR